jgi:antitoxin component YwqK of YwqJK toxin-antitoxin module
MATLTEHKSETELYFEDEHGKKQGEYKWRWYSNGQLGIHCFYVDGNIHGEYKWWYSNGQLATHCYYADGKRHGEYKEWYSNGQTWVHCFFVDGNRHGESKSWHPNGKLGIHCFYQNGEVVVDFFTEPELYPTSVEVKTYFALKYGWTKWLP